MNRLLLSILVLASSSISLVLALDGPLDGSYLRARKSQAASISEGLFDRETTFKQQAEQKDGLTEAIATISASISYLGGASYKMDAELFSVLLQVNIALKEVNTRLDRLERAGSPRQVAQRKRRSRRRRRA